MWQQLDPDDMLNVLTQPERDLFGSGSSATGMPDRLGQILSQVVSLVRGKVAAFAENRAGMGPDGTIPEELYSDAVEIARFKFLTAFPQGKLFLDDARIQLYKDAIKHLDDCAAGKLFIEFAAARVFVPDAMKFASRDDYLADPSKLPNINVVDFGFWH
jgi:hypothetical protein